MVSLLSERKAARTMRATFSNPSKSVEQISGGAATLASPNFASSHLRSPLDAIGQYRTFTDEPHITHKQSFGSITNAGQ